MSVIENYIIIGLFLFVFYPKVNENIHLVFDLKSSEKCKVHTEQTSSNQTGISLVKKYRKQIKDDVITFFICNEKFVHIKYKCKIDTLSSNFWDKTEIQEISYMLDRKNEDPLRYNPFDTIFIVEKTLKNEYIRYEVKWVDEWSEIEDTHK